MSIVGGTDRHDFYNGPVQGVNHTVKNKNCKQMYYQDVVNHGAL